MVIVERETMNYQYISLEMAHLRMEEILRDKGQSVKNTPISVEKLSPRDVKTPEMSKISR
jgi:hypothetical protein